MSYKESIQEGLKEVLESYPELGVENPSSFMLIDDIKSSCWIKGPTACHGDMPYLQPGQWDRMITAVPMAKPNDLAYIAMLIDGPFRGFSDLITLNKDVDSGLYYLELTNLDKWPANVLYNFCIATRVPIEWPGILSYWSYLVAKGYNATLAFLISTSNHGRPFKKERVWNYTNHMWLDATSDWGTILSGSPLMTCKSYKSSPESCTPTNKIWGQSTDYAKLIKASDEEIADHFALTPVPLKPKPVRKSRSKSINAGFNQLFGLDNLPPGPGWGQVAHNELQVVPAEPVPVDPQPFADWDFPDDPEVDDHDDDHDPFDDFHEDIDDDDF